MATHTYITRSAKTKEGPGLSSEVESLAGQAETVTLGGSPGEVPSIHSVASGGTTSSAPDHGEATVEPVSDQIAGMDTGASITTTTDKAASLSGTGNAGPASAITPATTIVTTSQLHHTNNTHEADLS